MQYRHGDARSQAVEREAEWHRAKQIALAIFRWLERMDLCIRYARNLVWLPPRRRRKFFGCTDNLVNTLRLLDKTRKNA